MAIKSTRAPDDRRDGWGPQCNAHEHMNETVIRLDAALYWIRAFCGGIFAVALLTASIGLPMIYQMNKAVSCVLEEHGTRLTKLEGWQHTREQVLPTGRLNGRAP